ncbi:O-succinylbenzoate-CoA ligase [Thermaerobacter marianensis DSM 12885]|uniref:2-succinylbenzoate--CoA ligase n=1 Tax=Thermaerobacter marianensis (strain ATCC 700841 / DSM 12885 / JCM 10246 / 7p75a) TaxID=644966 RepID=E6SH58_THEM7|nr:o-succinylbenzoate--CoA ligase [Thermaerobacter marianensis]ADU51722.1 O-succinylbenzoate-CoA ligase [Thermaerobacter marianensis DSM 12885]
MVVEPGAPGHEAGGLRHVPDWLRRQAELQPGGLAIVAGRERWTFARLDERVATLTAHLARIGVEPGQRVAVLAGNGLPYVILVHALIRVRAILVPLNVRLAPAELAWQIRDAGARWLIHDDDQAEHAAAVLAALEAFAAQDHGVTGDAAAPPQPLSLSRLLAAAGDLASTGPAAPQAAPAPPSPPSLSPASPSSALPSPPPPIDLAAPHCIIYTSGTTGRPKGAVLTYGNHFWSAVASALNLGLHRDDRWLCCLPLFHVSGLSIVFRSVIYGIPMVLHPRFDPAAVNASIERDRVTVISVVATMLQRMLDERGPRPYPEHLRCVLLGGGPAPRPLLEACAARSIPVVQTYGMTETASQFATLAPADALRKLGSAGKPLFFNELRIVDDDGRPVPPGEVGEIVVRGPTVTPGYHNRPDATARAWRDGWFHTGDLGYVDEDGYLYVADRRDDLIISGGENVYPAEIESVLLAHPAVEEAGVVGVPDPEWGQVPVAVVRLRSPARWEGEACGGERIAGHEGASGRQGQPGRPKGPGDEATGGSATGPDQKGAAGRASLEEALLRFCAERLARYKVPRRVLFTTEPLPRTASGKLQRHRLRRTLDRLHRPEP